MEKGEAIRFVKGTYAGLIGWKNKAKKKIKGSPNVPVIVQVDKKLKATKVRLTSYRDPFTDPASKEAAAIQQHPDLELAMIDLAAIWAQMGTIDTRNVLALFTTELEQAQKNQKKLKGKARFRSVEYPCKCRLNEDEMSMESY